MKSKIRSALLAALLLLAVGCSKQAEEPAAPAAPPAPHENAGDTTIIERAQSAADGAQQLVETAPTVESKLEADFWQEESVPTDGSVLHFAVDRSEMETHIVLRPVGEIRELRFQSLEFCDIDSNGVILYDEEELYSCEVLDRPLVVTLTFYGDMTTYGVSFIDSHGAAQYFTISISGMDGSLELLPRRMA